MTGAQQAVSAGLCLIRSDAHCLQWCMCRGQGIFLHPLIPYRKLLPFLPEGPDDEKARPTGSQISWWETDSLHPLWRPEAREAAQWAPQAQSLAALLAMWNLLLRCTEGERDIPGESVSSNHKCLPPS